VDFAGYKVYQGTTAGTSVTFTVSFDQSAGGKRVATITIASNDANENPYDFSIQGAGVAPPAAPKNFRSN
jgi:hypothetical protein